MRHHLANSRLPVHCPAAEHRVWRRGVGALAQVQRGPPHDQAARGGPHQGSKEESSKDPHTLLPVAAEHLAWPAHEKTGWRLEHPWVRRGHAGCTDPLCSQVPQLHPIPHRKHPRGAQHHGDGARASPLPVLPQMAHGVPSAVRKLPRRRRARRRRARRGAPTRRLSGHRTRARAQVSALAVRAGQAAPDALCAHNGAVQTKPCELGVASHACALRAVASAALRAARQGRRPLAFVSCRRESPCVPPADARQGLLTLAMASESGKEGLWNGAMYVTCSCTRHAAAAAARTRQQLHAHGGPPPQAGVRCGASPTAPEAKRWAGGPFASRRARRSGPSLRAPCARLELPEHTHP